ncbi:MAG: SLBB domain-containing protein [Pseudomonadales bacterium]|nr:SLBB domain-containing protein [Pseudomonadales bacterium]
MHAEIWPNEISIKEECLNIMNFRSLVIHVSKYLLMLSIVLGGGLAAARSVDIQQLRNMSSMEQKALADEFGIDLNEIDRFKSGVSESLHRPDQIGPREAKTNKDSHRKKAVDIVASPSLENGSGVDVFQLKQFGYELFAGNPFTFEPDVVVSVPNDYIFGPGDSIFVQIYGKESWSKELFVNRDGKLQFPGIGPVAIAGLSFLGAKKYIGKIVSERIIGANISITMGTLKSIQIFVLGEVYRSGTYTVSALSTMTNGLYVSGGVKGIGSLRNIQLKRQGKVIADLDLYDLLLHGDTSGDQRLMSGDVIFIPPVGNTVGISGEVRRPAVYEIKNEKTVADIISLSGGLLPTAYLGAYHIDRINKNGERTIVDMNLNTSRGQSLNIFNGDIIEIAPVLDLIEGVVVIKGHVHRPGGIAWKPGLRVSNIIPSVRHLLPSPDLHYALIKRELKFGRNIDMIAFDIGNAIKNPGSEMDPELMPRDQVYIFGLNNAQRNEILNPIIRQLEIQALSTDPMRLVTVSGNVKFPGLYPLTRFMDVAGLISAAGGFTEKAYDVEAEITRSSVDKKSFQKIERVLLDLKGNGLQVPLMSKDQLYIKQIPNWNERAEVNVGGEVNYPGVYPIFNKDTISDLISRAGGLTEFADPNAAIFLRENLRIKMQQNIEKLKGRLEKDLMSIKSDAYTMDVSDNNEVLGEKLLSQLSSSNANGRLVIDLPSILKGDKGIDLKLKDKDFLMIPSKSSEVTVLGEVQFQTSHTFKGGEDVFDYIEKSGGLTSKADKKRIYVINVNGNVIPIKRTWFVKRGTTIAHGDTIVIPYNINRTTALTYWNNVSKVLFNLSTTLAALNSVGVFK